MIVFYIYPQLTSLVSTQIEKFFDKIVKYEIKVPKLEPRLQNRYRILVQQHLSPAQSVASGLRNLPNTAKSFTAAQAAWRFYQNKRVTLPLLAEPIINQARELSLTCSNKYCLVMHDFSVLNFSSHESKADRLSLYRLNDFGYFLQSALLVSDISGNPLAPLYLGLEAASGVHSSRRETVLPRRRQLDELNRTFGYVESLGLKRPCVHIVDRQADSLVHLRRFERCQRSFVIRSDDVRRVTFEGESLLLAEVEERIQEKLEFVREIELNGKKAWQYVAETEVVLERLGRLRYRSQENEKKRKWIKGKVLKLRLILSEVRDSQDKVLSIWRLWTNVKEVKGEEIALWYYWRWRIESYFKLLKRGGQFLEQWQQESAEAIAKRLLIVAQVCVIVWTLAESKEEKAKEIRQFLISLSGRLMKRRVEYTTPALLAGMWQLLAIIDALERFTAAELLEIAKGVLDILGDKPNFKEVK